MFNSGVLISIAALCVALLGLVVAISCLIRLSSLQSQLAKFAFLVREDTKKFFDEAGQQAVELSKKTLEDSTESLKGALGQVSDSAIEKIAKVVKEAEEEAAVTRAKTREEADRLIAAAKEEAAIQLYASSKQAATAVEWAMEQWLHQEMSVQQHAALIERLVVTYLDDRK